MYWAQPPPWLGSLFSNIHRYPAGNPWNIWERHHESLNGSGYMERAQCFSGETDAAVTTPPPCLYSRRLENVQYPYHLYISPSTRPGTNGPDRPFQCPTCGVRFTRIQNLKQHMLIHSGRWEVDSAYQRRRGMRTCDLSDSDSPFYSPALGCRFKRHGVKKNILGHQLNISQ